MPPFADKSSLQAAAQEYNTDVTAATYKYGPIASWDVSAITDMSYLFDYASHFNENISSWDTSSVTDMESMFEVRSAPVYPHPPQSVPPCTLLAPPPLPHALPTRPACRPFFLCFFLLLGRWRMRSTSR